MLADLIFELKKMSCILWFLENMSDVSGITLQICKFAAGNACSSIWLCNTIDKQRKIGIGSKNCLLYKRKREEENHRSDRIRKETFKSVC